MPQFAVIKEFDILDDESHASEFIGICFHIVTCIQLDCIRYKTPAASSATECPVT